MAKDGHHLLLSTLQLFLIAEPLHNKNILDAVFGEHSNRAVDAYKTEAPKP